MNLYVFVLVAAVTIPSIVIERVTRNETWLSISIPQRLQSPLTMARAIRVYTRRNQFL